MLSLLEQSQNGTLGPRSLMISEITRRLFNLELSKHRNVEESHDGGINVMDIDSIENRYLLSGSNNGSIAIHDLQNSNGQPSYTCKSIGLVQRLSQETNQGHRYSVETVLWYPFDTGMFTTSGMDKRLILWDTNYLKAVDEHILQGKVFSHSMSPIATHHSLIAASLSYPHVILIDLKSGSKCHELRGHKGDIISVKWSPSSEYLLASGGSDNRILLWDIRSAKGYLSALDQHNGEAVSSRKGLITAHNGIVNYLHFTPDGLHLVSCGTDSRLRLWDVAKSLNTLVNFGRILNDNPKGVQFDLCYDNCIPCLFYPTGSDIVVLDLFTGATISTLLGHLSITNCCVFRPDYHEVYSGGNDRNILIWSPDVEIECNYFSYKVENSSSRVQSKPGSKFGVDAWSSDED